MTAANPEALARKDIDCLLIRAGSYVCDYWQADIHAAMGVASLDIFWLNDESPADFDDLKAALDQLRLIAGDLNGDDGSEVSA